MYQWHFDIIFKLRVGNLIMSNNSAIYHLSNINSNPKKKKKFGKKIDRTTQNPTVKLQEIERANKSHGQNVAHYLK